MSFKSEFERIIAKIKAHHRYLHGNKGLLEKQHKRLKNTKPKKVLGKIGRVAGLAGIDISWFLFCLGKFGLNDIFLDNFVVNAWEKEKLKIKTKDTDSKFKKFFKNLQKSHPLAAARLQLWMVYALLTGLSFGGVKIVQNKENIKRAYIEFKQRHGHKVKVDEVKIDPSLPQQEWEKQMDAIWPYLYMETVLSEGFINEAYADVGDAGGYLTIGSGYMIGKANPKTKTDRDIIKERKAFFKEALGKHYVNGVTISYEENRILVRRYYEKYVWPRIKKDFTVPMDIHLFIELCIGSYNRGNGIYSRGGKNIRQAVNSGKSTAVIANMFDDLHVAGNDGLLPKYGIAAHRVLGNISDEDVLNSCANAVYQFSKNDLWKGGVLIPYDSIASDLVRLDGLVVRKNGKTYPQHRVREYMYGYEIENISQGYLFGEPLQIITQNQEKKESSAEQLNEQAEALFDEGNYVAALEMFEAAIKADPSLHIVYSNLSLVYYKLGEYEKGIDVARRFIQSQYFKSAPASIKGYTYYNAALCYEKLGDNTVDVDKKKSYYEQAKKNAELGEHIANTQYYVFNKRINGKILELSKQKSKKTAFIEGALKIKYKQNQQDGTFVYPFDNEYQA